jgi:hypothetical protein
MLIIRKSQQGVLASYAEAQFRDRILARLQSVFPDQCRIEGIDAIRTAISRGIERAGRYGIVTEYDVARFIDLTAVLGWDFDTSGKPPWAVAVLRRKDVSAASRIDRIYEGIGRAP